MEEYTEYPEGGLVAASSADVAIYYNEYGTPSYAGIWTDIVYSFNQVVVDPNDSLIYICIGDFLNNVAVPPSEHIDLFGEQRWRLYSSDLFTTINYLNSIFAISLSGSADVSLNYFSQNGIVRTAGTSDVSCELNPIIAPSGLKASSSSIVGVLRTSQTSGGFNAGGTSVFRVRFFVIGSGGFAGGGQSNITDSLVFLGGARLSGNSLNQLEVNPDFVSSGAKCSGINLLLINNDFFYKSSGQEITISSNFDFGIKNARFVASGGVQLVSQGFDNFEFYKTISFKWKRNAYLFKNVDFYWNLGQLTMYWYRVVGKGVQDPCLGDPCCQKIVINVHARSLSELCQKLSQRRYKFPIDTVQRFRVPAETEVINNLKDAGENVNCNDLIDVEICKVPECANFCIDYDFVLQIGASMKVNMVEQVIALGGLQAGGATIVSVTPPAKPNLPYTSTGQIFLENGADYTTNSFVGRGGSVLSGVANFRHSKWKFVGGTWPDNTGNKFGKQAITKKRQKDETPWLLPERVLKQDFLYTTTDISYNKSSQYLIVKNFNFDLPDNCKILSVVLRVNCLATQVGIRDQEVLLILNNKIISKNLAVTGIDWPLIQTTRTYGSSGWKDQDFQPADLPILSILSTTEDLYLNEKFPTRDELSNSNFGVAISVKNINSTPSALARIEYATIEVTYEDPINSIIRLTSDSGSTAKSPSYTSKAQGKIRTTGEASFGLARFFVQKLPSKGVIVQPNSLRSRTMSIGGGILVNGQSKVTPYINNMIVSMKVGGVADVRPFIEYPSGGILASAEADVKPWWETMAGGSTTSGESFIETGFSYTASGQIEISGLAFTPENKFNYGASGGIQISGKIEVRKPFWKFDSDGNVLFIFGQAMTVAGNITLPNEIWTFDMTITFNNATFLKDIDLQNAEGNLEYKNRCGCFELPSAINLVHNFAQDNILAKFLIRNNFSISKSLELRYNSVNDSWQNNLHYKGYSAIGENLESWDIVSELQCTKEVGGIILGANIWKLALQFSRKNLLTGQSYESRIVIGVVPENICVNFASKLDFQITFDVSDRTAIISPAATLYQNTLFDNIGLFKNRAWIENPNLNLRVVQSAPSPNRRSYIIPTAANGTNPGEPSPFYTNANSKTMLKSS